MKKKQEMVLGLLMLFVFLITFPMVSSSATLVFPVDGLLGDSYVPRDTDKICADYDSVGARKNYTMVWAGMYGEDGVCYNERYKYTGAHPGFDIAGVTGEKIYAIANGTVIISECDTGWGGLVVIKHTPSQLGISGTENYFSVYAHLRQRDVSAIQNVSAGDTIGLMGGATTDECHGASTGRHLHFQIDVGEIFNRQGIAGYNASEPSDPHYNTIKTDTPESYDSELPNETVDPIDFLESNYSYFVGKHEDGNWYFENNSGSYWSEPLADVYRNNGGQELLGVPINNAHLCNNFPGYNPYGTTPAVYVQDTRKDGHQFTLVINPYVSNASYDFRSGVGYPVHGKIHDYWIWNYSSLGAPVTNEYYYSGSYSSNPPRYVVQWFERVDEDYYVVIHDTWENRTWHESDDITGVPKENFEQHKQKNIAGGAGGGSSANSVYPPENLGITSVTTSSISINWDQGLNSSSGITYKIYRDNNYINSTSSTSYTDSGLSDDTTYTYKLTAVVDGVESSPSTSLTATTQEIITVPEVNVISDAVTKEIVDNYPQNPTYSYIFSQVPVDIYAWAEVDISNISVNDLYWTFNNATGGSATSGTTTRVSLGGDRYLVYTVLYSTNTSCDGAYGTWTAKLRGVNGAIMHTVNFSMNMKKPTFIYADNVTESQLQLHWSDNSCETGYVIYRNGQLLTEVDNTSLTFTDTNLDTPPASYIYQVAAKFVGPGGTFQSDFTSSQEVVIEAPLDFAFVGSYVCESWEHGSTDPNSPVYWDLQPINVGSNFLVNDTAQFLVKLEDVYVDHRYKMELYRNGYLLREQTTGWNDLDPGQSWDYSSFAPYQQDLMPGNYVITFYLDTGGGFTVLDSNSFTVTGPNYEYAGSWTCDGWAYGSTDPNSPVYWDWQPVNPRSSFYVGDTVYLLSQLNDVFVDHEWKMEVWKNGSFQWAWPSGWLDVDNVNGWGYSNFAPYIQNVSAGNYELKLYLDDGNGFFLIDSKPFTVSAFTENIPYSEDFSTDDHKFTLEDHLSTASLSVSETGGVSGGRALHLTNNQSVQPCQVQAKKVGFNLIDSTSYTGNIKIRGEGTGTIYILFERAVSPWDNLGLWRAVNVTSSWQTINLDFTATGNPELDAENVRFTIQAGSFVGGLYIDDISLN